MVQSDQTVNRTASRSLRHYLFWPLALGGLALDLWTKRVAFARIDPYDGVVLIKGFLSFNLAYNDGAAFSLFSGYSQLLAVISVVALLVVLVLFLTGRAHTWLLTVSFGLLTGGIAGNLYDRLFLGGRVRDFIDVYVGKLHWPTFNLADSMLCVAVGLLIIALNTNPKSHPAHDPPQK